MVYICAYCDGAEQFKNKQKLVKHIRTHTSTRIIARNQRISCCFCDEKYATYVQYEKHVESSHDVILEKEKLSFKTESEFLEWKDSLNKEGKHYSKDSCRKKIKDGYVEYFRCHRSYAANITKGIRIKSTGSVKIGNACVSQMKVIYYEKRNDVLVYYTKTHIGHQFDVGKVPLLKCNKPKIVEAISTDSNTMIKDKIIKIYNKELYPKENEEEINNLLDKLIEKMDTTACTHISNGKGTKPKKLIKQKSPCLHPTVKRKPEPKEPITLEYISEIHSEHIMELLEPNCTNVVNVIGISDQEHCYFIPNYCTSI